MIYLFSSIIILFFFNSSLFSSNFSLPKFDKTVLKNGFTIYTMERKNTSLINYNLSFKCGSVYDSKKLGLNYLTFKNLLNGTKKYSKSQIEEKTEFLGSNILLESGNEISAFNALFFTKDQALFDDIFLSIVSTPLFLQSEFSKSKKLILNKLNEEFESPKNVIRKYFDRFLYENHPYGNPYNGIPKTIKKISIKDLKKYHGACVSPNRGVLSVVGKIDSNKILPKLKRSWGSWKSKGNPMPNIKPPTIKKGKNVLIVDKPDAYESTYILGGKGIERNNPKYVDLMVLNTILGGRFTSWLNDELRVKSGLTYGAKSRFYSKILGGNFAISTFTKSSNTKKALIKTSEVYKKLLEDKVDEKTLNSAKNYILGQFPPTLETSRKLGTFLTSMHHQNISNDYIDTFEEKINGVNFSNKKKLIEKFFPKTEDLSLVIIGNKKNILSHITNYGKIYNTKISDQSFFTKN